MILEICNDLFFDDIKLYFYYKDIKFYLFFIFLVINVFLGVIKDIKYIVDR